MYFKSGEGNKRTISNEYIEPFQSTLYPLSAPLISAGINSFSDTFFHRPEWLLSKDFPEAEKDN